VPVDYEIDKFYDKNKKLDPSLPKALNITDKWAVYESKKNFLKDYIKKIPFYLNELQSEKGISNIKTQFSVRQNTEDNLSSVEIRTALDDNFIENKEVYSQAGIIFCPHRSSTGLSVIENAKSLKSYTSKIGTFMGSGDKEDAEEIDQESFKNLEHFRENNLPLMVATKAFGMGIDKSNVRFTVNLNYSSSLESFVQEAGRAGRDKKIALSTILIADYKLARINPKCPTTSFPMFIIRNKWFKEEELEEILSFYNLSIDEKYIDYYTPNHDLVKLRCEVDNKRFGFNECNTCPKFNNCNLSKVPSEAKGFQYIKDLEDLLLNNGLELPVKNLEYLNADYDTVMFFYNNNFKGSIIEKEIMFDILNNTQTNLFLHDDEEYKEHEIETVDNFLTKLQAVEIGTEIVSFISYENNYADFAKAIYRMSCIGLIDDFTQDYSLKRFRVVTKRKEDGAYYEGLKKFLTRYYSDDRAIEEIEKVKSNEEENEIKRCLSYLTEFIYDKIAVKRKRAIDDIRNFCLLGIDQMKDWKDLNEELKDDLYYYFNSKFAKDDYETEKGEMFSLTRDTDRGKKSSFEVLFKYFRVITEEVYGSSGSPKDSIKHLQGAVRLIRRSLTDKNPSLAMLNTFCIAYLGTNENETLELDMENSFKEGYQNFYTINEDKEHFYTNIEKMFSEFSNKDISKKYIEKMNDWKLEIELDIHQEWLNKFAKSYIIK
jgi:hypothetical protein